MIQQLGKKCRQYINVVRNKIGTLPLRQNKQLRRLRRRHNIHRP
jgi:hypothetical protein